MLWQHLKTSEFPEAVKKSKGVCVIPVGAMEKHGPHMPVGTDNIIADRTTLLAAEKEPVVIFPTFCFGQVQGIQHFDGTVGLSSRLVIELFDEICREISRSGFKKILLLNSHGGNPALLQVICQQALENKRDYVLAWAESYCTYPKDLRKALTERREDFPYITDEDVAIVEDYFSEKRQEFHADFDEALLVCDEDPTLIDMSRMDEEDGESTHKSDHLAEAKIYTARNWFMNFPNSFSASYFPHINERIARAYTEIRVDYIAGVLKAFKEDTTLLEENEKWNTMW